MIGDLAGTQKPYMLALLFYTLNVTLPWGQRIDGTRLNCYYWLKFFPARWMVALLTVPGRVFFVPAILIRRLPSGLVPVFPSSRMASGPA